MTNFENGRKRHFWAQCAMSCGKTAKLDEPKRWICDECEAKARRVTQPSFPVVNP